MTREEGAFPATRGPLAERLRRRILAEGPMPFDRFMDAALYDRDEGFYAGIPVGQSGHFWTSPHVSDVFGSLMARQVDDFWDLLDGPPEFALIEVGAGDGTLAAQILPALRLDVRASVRYTAVERSPEARRALSARGLAATEGLDGVAGDLPGCVLANEVLDNLPFHRVRRREDGLVELCVDVREGEFELTEGPPPGPEVAALVDGLEVGQEGVACPEALALVGQAARSVSRGYMWLADYASTPGGTAPVHGYRGHRVLDDVLSDPGSRDITAGVDLPAVRRHAQSLGLSAWGPVSQAQALRSLGIARWSRAALERQGEAMREGRGFDAIRAYSDRNRAGLLVDPAGLGAMQVLCLGVGVPPDAIPRSVREPG